MNAKRMLLRFLIGNGTYDRLVRMNVIQDAGVVGRRARGQSDLPPFSLTTLK